MTSLLKNNIISFILIVVCSNLSLIFVAIFLIRIIFSVSKVRNLKVLSDFPLTRLNCFILSMPLILLTLSLFFLNPIISLLAIQEVF